MPNERLAERILAMVTTPDRAAAIVGDLVEDTAAPFWESVARTGTSLLWREMSESTVPAIARAVVLWIPYILYCVFFTVIGNLVASFLFSHTGIELVADYLPDPHSWAGPFVWYALGPFVFGRAIARVSEDRELAAAAIAGMIWPLLALVTKVPMPDSPMVQLCLLAGAVPVRAGRLSGVEASVRAGPG